MSIKSLFSKIAKLFKKTSKSNEHSGVYYVLVYQFSLNKCTYGTYCNWLIDIRDYYEYKWITSNEVIELKELALNKFVECYFENDEVD